MKKEYITPEVNVISFTSSEFLASWNPNGWFEITTSAEFSDPWYDVQEE